MFQPQQTQPHCILRFTRAGLQNICSPGGKKKGILNLTFLHPWQLPRNRSCPTCGAGVPQVTNTSLLKLQPLFWLHLSLWLTIYSHFFLSGKRLVSFKQWWNPNKDLPSTSTASITVKEPSDLYEGTTHIQRHEIPHRHSRFEHTALQFHAFWSSKGIRSKRRF